MGKRSALLLLVLVMCHALVATVGGYEDEGRREKREEGEGEEGWGSEGDELFLLHDSKHVVKTDAGDMRVVRGRGGRVLDNKPVMHIGFITMEPRSLFIPQYLDSSLVLFIRTGEVRVGHIYEDELVEIILKTGDVYRIAAGSAFYMENTAQGQKLHVICSIDTSQSLGWNTFQSFFIGGGRNPPSILAGFDPQTLSAAFNVSESEIREILTRQQSGAIIYLHDSHPPNMWTQFLKLEHHERKNHLKRIVHFEEVETNQAEDQPKWSLRKLLISVFGMENNNGEVNERTAPDSYNIYDRRPDYENNYGWSKAVDESDYSPLGHSDIGIYLVNLTAGSMMAPHINPIATEYGIVLRGSGRIEIVYPNGSLAMNAKVSEGEVFRVPRYFPFCQIASRSGPFEFFGFSTSAHKNRPQFLAGSNSLLQTMKGPEVAASFGITEERLKKILDAQREHVILPAPSVAPPDKTVEWEKGEMGEGDQELWQ